MKAPRIASLDIGGTKLASAIVAADGTVHGHQVIPTAAADGAETVLDRAVGLLQDVLAAEQRERGTPAGLGISTNGLTRPHGVDLAPAVPGWSRLRIPARIGTEFPGLPCAIVNDLKAGAEAELAWGELRGISTGLYLNFGTGVGATIISGGQVAQGANGAAGEIAYLLPDAAALERLQPGETPLEDLMGGRGVARWASAELGRPVTMAEIITSAGDGETGALYDRLTRLIELWTVNLTIMVDPQRVVLGGGLVRGGAAPLLDRLQSAVRKAVPFPAEVRRARFGADSALVGAGAVALRLIAGQ
jgi:glucokinase